MLAAMRSKHSIALTARLVIIAGLGCLARFESWHLSHCRRLPLAVWQGYWRTKSNRSRSRWKLFEGSVDMRTEFECESCGRPSPTYVAEITAVYFHIQRNVGFEKED